MIVCLFRKGLRVTVILGAVGTMIGAWIKVLGVHPDRFFVVLIGQTVTALAQVFILGVPPNVAAVWFGPEEVSSACAIGVFGNQVLCISATLWCNGTFNPLHNLSHKCVDLLSELGSLRSPNNTAPYGKTKCTNRD